MPQTTKQLIDAIAIIPQPKINQLIPLLKMEHNDYLWVKANEIRKKYCGDEIHLRGIIEFSNYCHCNCLYCGLRKDNQTLKRYRLTPEKIFDIAQKAYQVGYKTIVLQSGEDPFYTAEMIASLIQQIKNCGEIAVTLSLGERKYEEYALWKKAGADRYLLKHETADPHLYQKLHPHSSLEKRLRCLHWLKNLGYQVGSGFMIGLPGQTLESIARDLLLLKELKGAMASIGPFLPHPQTPLGISPKTDHVITLSLKAIALARIMLKTTHLPTTTAFELTAGTNAFAAGANVLMRKVQPLYYRQLYEIYPQAFGSEKTLAQERKELEEYIHSCKRTVSLTKGDALQKQINREDDQQ